MTDERFNPLDDDEDEELEALRERLIAQLEAAYFSGIGPAALEISDVKRAGPDELRKLARDWGVR